MGMGLAGLSGAGQGRVCGLRQDQKQRWMRMRWKTNTMPMRVGRRGSLVSELRRVLECGDRDSIRALVRVPGRKIFNISRRYSLQVMAARAVA